MKMTLWIVLAIFVVAGGGLYIHMSRTGTKALTETNTVQTTETVQRNQANARASSTPTLNPNAIPE